MVQANETTVPILGFLYIRGPFKWAYHSLVKERRITIAILDTVFCFSALTTQYFLAVSMGARLAISIYKSVARFKDSSQQRLVKVFSQHPRFVGYTNKL